MTAAMALEVVATDERDLASPTIDLDRWQRLAHDVLLDALTSSTDGLHIDPSVATRPGELNLLFVDTEAMRDLNQTHMGGTGPTDVLSFPIDDLDENMGDDDIRLFGDIVISPEVAIAQAETHTGDVDDEFALLVVHGVLHLLGFDHGEPADASAMHAAERRLLTRWHRSIVVPEHAALREKP